MPKSRGRRPKNRKRTPARPTRTAERAAIASGPVPSLVYERPGEPYDNDLYATLKGRGWAAWPDESGVGTADGHSFDWPPSLPPDRLVAEDHYAPPTYISVEDDGYAVYAPQLDDRATPPESYYTTKAAMVADLERIEGLRYSPIPGAAP